MADIMHKIEMKADRNDVYRALSTIDGLSGWWTSTTAGESAPGKIIEFRFNQHLVRMQVKELEAGKKVVWECLESAPEWVGTRISFDLSEEAGRTTLYFGHGAWREANPFFAHCSMKWATFLLSLRDYAETGTGKPFPRDVQI